jgi:hypothetical protein
MVRRRVVERFANLFLENLEQITYDLDLDHDQTRKLCWFMIKGLVELNPTFIEKGVCGFIRRARQYYLN